MSETIEGEGREVETTQATESGTLAVLQGAEIDRQIATAKKYPRSLKAFRNEALEMVTLTEEIADECLYALPRDGKTIEGPSARFAEIVASAWGNCRAGARVVSESGEFITAQGVFHDLQRNVSITYEVQRRITDKNGRRYKPDMIGVTGNAASSVALRNAILKGVPKAFWNEMYEAARKTVRGDVQTLANRRAAALKAFQGFGVVPEQIYAKLGVKGEEDITIDHLLVLRGMLTAIKEGDTTPEDAFGPVPGTVVGGDGKKPEKGNEAVKDKLKGKSAAKADPEHKGKPSYADLIKGATTKAELDAILKEAEVVVKDAAELLALSKAAADKREFCD